MTLLTDDVRAWIGREATYTAPEPIGAAAFRYFATAIGDDNPLYTDAGFARANGYRDVVAPPTLICETNQYVGGVRGADGLIGHWWDIEVPGTRAIRGGNEYEFHRPLYPDDVVTATWRVADITERAGSDGTPMLVVLSEARYTNQDGELLAVNTETIIYR
ncbi:MAG TPA: MaoC family dehydratase N-terminal domain-containing protein [Actinomycetota bacterium]